MTLAAGFFAGAIPGAILVVVNMIHMTRSVNAVIRQAREEGQDLSFVNYPDGQMKLLRDPGKLFSTSDSASLRAAKQMLLRNYKWYMARHVAAGLLLFLGVAVGVLVAGFSSFD